VGTKPVYDTAFYVPPRSNPDKIFNYVPSGVPVRPGDRVVVRVRATATRSAESIRVLGSSRQASVTGGGVTQAGVNIGMVALEGNASGPTSIGNAITPTSPAPSAPASFLYNYVDGHRLTLLPGLTADEWTSPADPSQVLAAPTAISARQAFAVAVSS